MAPEQRARAGRQSMVLWTKETSQVLCLVAWAFCKGRDELNKRSSPSEGKPVKPVPAVKATAKHGPTVWRLGMEYKETSFIKQRSRLIFQLRTGSKMMDIIYPL